MITDTDGGEQVSEVHRTWGGMTYRSSKSIRNPEIIGKRKFEGMLQSQHPFPIPLELEGVPQLVAVPVVSTAGSSTTSEPSTSPRTTTTTGTGLHWPCLIDGERPSTQL